MIAVYPAQSTYKGVTSRVSCAVMSHPDRAPLLRQLQSAIGTKHLTTVLDLTGPPHQSRIWPMARMAAQLVTAGATHHMVLSDDAGVCPNFLAGMAHLADLQPDFPISPYAQRAHIMQAREAGEHWIADMRGAYGLGIMFPVRLLDDILWWIDRYIKPDYPHDDARYNYYLLTHNVPVYVTSPSLIQHLAPRASLIGGRGSIKNWSPYALEGDPLALDWTRGLTPHPSIQHAAWGNYKDPKEIDKAFISGRLPDG